VFFCLFYYGTLCLFQETANLSRLFLGRGAGQKDIQGTVKKMDKMRT